MMNQDFLTQDEMQIAQMVRATIHAATQPTPGQLAALMPPPPVQTKTAVPVWTRQWAALAACILLLVGSLGLYFARQNYGGYGPALPTQLAVTATMTNIPTSTIAQNDGIEEDTGAATAVATQPALFAPAIKATPAPNPTPIAALMPVLSSN
ncbi:MAG: hypothetical protein R3E31_29160 [Chloroflexota bacterium]